MHPKALVDTVGPHQYLDLTNDTLIRHDRPTLVEVTPYVAQLVSRAQLNLLRSNLNPAMTDAAFAERLVEAEGDHELAIEAYLSEFDEPVEKPKKAAPSKAAGN